MLPVSYTGEVCIVGQVRCVLPVSCTCVCYLLVGQVCCVLPVSYTGEVCITY